MRKWRFKKPVIYTGYVLGFMLVVGLIYMIESSISKSLFVDDFNDYDYVSRTIFDDVTPVVNLKQTIVKPFEDTNIKIVKNFYDYMDDKEKQESSLIFNNDTYLQNSGVDYGGVEKFNVINVLDGVVITVKEDKLLGKIVEVKHENDLITVYQSLSEVQVKQDDELKQGDIIGKSGTCNLASGLGDHLHFELIYNGQMVNPEEFYFKKLSDLKGT